MAVTKDIFDTITGAGSSKPLYVSQDMPIQVLVSGTFEAAATATVELRKDGTDFVSAGSEAVLTTAGVIPLTSIKAQTEVRVTVAGNASNVLKISIS